MKLYLQILDSKEYRIYPGKNLGGKDGKYCIAMQYNVNTDTLYRIHVIYDLPALSKTENYAARTSLDTV